MTYAEFQKQKVEQLVDYACEDADITLQLKDIFEPELKKTQTKELYDDARFTPFAIC